MIQLNAFQLIVHGYTRRMVQISQQDPVCEGWRNRMAGFEAKTIEIDRLLIVLEDIQDACAYKASSENALDCLLERMVYLTVHDPECSKRATLLLRHGKREIELPPFLIYIPANPDALSPARLAIGSAMSCSLLGEPE